MNSEQMADLYEKALEMAVMRMKGKRRKGGKYPMVIHSLRVGYILDRSHEPMHVVIAGVLHDLKEDAGVTASELKKVFGQEIAKIVLACSHNNRLHQIDRNAAQEDLFCRAEACGRDAIAVKVADAADNILSVQDLSPKRQQEFVVRAERWLKLGECHLGVASSLTRQLARRLERTKTVTQHL